MTKQYPTKVTGFAGRPRNREQAQARVVVLALGLFVLGIVVGVLFFRHNGARPHQNTNTGRTIQLSDATEFVLRHLNSPVEIRFYSLLDPKATPDALKSFAARVGSLLSAYESESLGKVKVVRIDTLSESNADAAAADGVESFGGDKGEASFLGIAVSGNAQKETLARLSPEWEGAVEPDLTRAIDRLNRARPPSTAPVVARDTTAVTAEVKNTIPNFDSVSLEQGTEMLRAAALKEFVSAASQLEARVREAQQRLAAAQKSNSPDEQQAAMKNLQQVQAEQADKVKEIAARLQDRIAVLKQMKRQ